MNSSRNRHFYEERLNKKDAQVDRAIFVFLCYCVQMNALIWMAAPQEVQEYKIMDEQIAHTKDVHL